MSGWLDQDYRFESQVRSEDEERLAYMSGQKTSLRGGSRDENTYQPRNLRTVWD